MPGPAGLDEGRVIQSLAGGERLYDAPELHR